MLNFQPRRLALFLLLLWNSPQIVFGNPHQRWLTTAKKKPPLPPPGWGLLPYSCRGGGPEDCNDEMKKVRIKRSDFPSSKELLEMFGGDDNQEDDNGRLLQLCATISNAMYDEDGQEKVTKAEQFHRKLMNVAEVKDAFGENENLKVVWYWKEAHFGNYDCWNNSPSFAAIIVDKDTLIMAWRGTSTVKDFVLDMNVKSIHPEGWGDSSKDPQVQSSYYELIKKYFRFSSLQHWTGKGKDIQNILDGTFAKAPEGTKIKRIILTGHSLGGGLAQVAHLFLTAPNDSPIDKLPKKIREHNVKVCTVAFSAPMTTAFTEKASSVDLQPRKEFRRVRNFVYRDDVVPRCYANSEFIVDVRKKILEVRGPIGTLLDKSIGLLVDRVLASQVEQREKYSHIGKVVFYGNACTRGRELDDAKFNEAKYGNNKTGKEAVDVALSDHMFSCKRTWTRNSKIKLSHVC